MIGIARVGDTMSHGNTLTNGSPNVTADSLAVVRVGDIYNCPTHGSVLMVSGSSNVFANGVAVCRLGDAASCGAVVTSASTDVLSD
jgi:uncharacterized Zn-binding protein involved in type VI secretion